MDSTRHVAANKTCDLHVTVTKSLRCANRHEFDEGTKNVSIGTQTLTTPLLVVAHDVFSCPRVATKPTTLQTVHSEYLQRSCSLVCFEEDLLSEWYNLLLESPALDAFMSCHAVAADVARRQRPCCISHK